MTKIASPGAPQQARSRRTMNRILDAAEALLAETSIERLGIAEITERAGVAAGSFYTRFKDKEDLLAHLFARYREDVRAMVDEMRPRLEAEPSLVARLGLVIDAVTDMYSQRRGVLRSVLLKLRHDPDYSNPEMSREFATFYELAARLLVGDGSEVNASEPLPAGRFCMQLIASYCRDAILYEEFPVQITTPRANASFRSALRAACLGVLQAGE